MKEFTKHKIGLPDWLKELINKGKYPEGKEMLLLKPSSYIYINNHKIQIFKFSEKLYSNNLKNLKDLHKVINNKKYTFSVEKCLIFIETNND